MTRIFAAVAVLCALALALSGCSGSDSDGGSGTLSVEQMIARWPNDLGALDLTPKSDTFVATIGKAGVDATDVQVRQLTDRGGFLGEVIGQNAIGAGSTPTLPDVVFISTSDGLAQRTDTLTLHTNALRGVFDTLGIAGYARVVDKPGSQFDGDPFAGQSGLRGGHLTYSTNVRLAGFAASRSGSRSSETEHGTWCAFVAHGVGVVVLGSTLTKAQDEQLAADLQK